MIRTAPIHPRIISYAIMYRTSLIELCDKIYVQHIRDDDNSYREQEFDRHELYQLFHDLGHIYKIPFSIHFTEYICCLVLSRLFLREWEIVGICLNSKGPGGL